MPTRRNLTVPFEVNMISELLLYNNHKKIILNNHYSYPFRIVSVWCIIILFDWKLLTNVSLCTLANLSLIFVGNDVKYGFRFYKNIQTHRILRMHVSITFPCGWYTINMLIIKSHFVYISTHAKQNPFCCPHYIMTGTGSGFENCNNYVFGKYD